MAASRCCGSRRSSSSLTRTEERILRLRVTNAEAGYTLLELLIALALLTVIASLLVNAIGSARQALNTVDRRGTQASVPAVPSVLRRLLVAARANPHAAGRADPHRALIGEP